MAKIVRWRGDNGQMAVSFPMQPLKVQPTPVIRQAHAAATHAADMLARHWYQTVGEKIEHPIGVSYRQHRDNLRDLRLLYEFRAYRRYLKLFKALGLK